LTREILDAIHVAIRVQKKASGASKLASFSTDGYESVKTQASLEHMLALAEGQQHIDFNTANNAASGEVLGVINSGKPYLLKSDRSNTDLSDTGTTVTQKGEYVSPTPISRNIILALQTMPCVPFHDAFIGVAFEMFVALPGGYVYPGCGKVEHDMHDLRRCGQLGINTGGKRINPFRPTRVCSPQGAAAVAAKIAFALILDQLVCLRIMLFAMVK